MGRDFKLSHAVVISVALVVLGALAFFDKESAAVVMGVVTLLGAFGFVAYQQSEIKEHAAAIRQQTNGGYTQLLRIIEKKDQEHAAAIAAIATRLAEAQKDQEHAAAIAAMVARLAEMQPLPPAAPPATSPDQEHAS